MTISDRLGISDAQEAAATWLLQVVLAGLAVYGVAIGEPAVTVNAAGGLAVTLLPALLRLEEGVRIDAGLVLWLAIATTLHAIGITGPYEHVWWWDHVTHALAGSIVAGAAYATLDAIDRSREEIHVPEPYRSVVLVTFVLATAVIWEVTEFTATQVTLFMGAQESVLVVFGPWDIVADIVYSGLGGIVVILWGRGYFHALSRKFSRAVFGESERGTPAERD